jgi:hypothetical protein
MLILWDVGINETPTMIVGGCVASAVGSADQQSGAQHPQQQEQAR